MVIALAVVAVVVLVRRWVHHAQLELVPVIVPTAADAERVVRPPASDVMRRMRLDIVELFARPQRARLAVLSFDDGPYPVTTPLLLVQLRSLGVPADFFLIGADAVTQPALSKRTRAGGMELANHTLTHPELTDLAPAAQQAEIAGGRDAIRRIAGDVSMFFRPPHGDYDARTLRAAQAEGQTVALWDVDPGDWRSISADAIVDSCLKQARAPAVILLHNGKLATIEALPRIVAAYRSAGFTFVTLSDLERAMPLDEINDPIRAPIR